MKIFGKALEFYRLRLQQVSEEAELDMDWSDSVLYRSQPRFEGKTTTYFQVQAVLIDSNKTFDLKRFLNKKEAVSFQKRANEELAILTKKKFEEKFIK